MTSGVEVFSNTCKRTPAEFFHRRKVLDAGCGNGRFAYYAAKYGAEVWAKDLGPAEEVAHRNTAKAGKAQVLKADLHRPPFAEGAQRWHAHHARDSRAGRLCH